MNINLLLEPIVAGTDPAKARLFPARFLAICTMALCLSTNLAAAVRMTFTGVNGAQMFGVYVGPYAGTMNGTPVDLFCVDFANEVNFGQQWDANLTSIDFGADLGDARYGAVPGALELYQQAAWLAQQFASQPASQYGDIQATIWQLFSPGAPTPSSSWWLEQARDNYATADYGDFRIVTNTGPVQMSGQVQEFLTRTQPNAPEPSTLLLAGLGLVGASCMGRRIRRARQLSRRTVRSGQPWRHVADRKLAVGQPNFGQPVNNLASPALGQIPATRTTRGDLGSSRQLQLGLKLIF
jgi:hypothetical protein